MKIIDNSFIHNIDIICSDSYFLLSIKYLTCDTERVEYFLKSNEVG